MPAFNTTLGLATQLWDVHDKDPRTARGSVPTTCLAEIGTLSMEFSAVSHISGGCLVVAARACHAALGSMQHISRKVLKQVKQCERMLI